MYIYVYITQSQDSISISLAWYHKLKIIVNMLSALITIDYSFMQPEKILRLFHWKPGVAMMDVSSSPVVVIIIWHYYHSWFSVIS